MKPFFLLCLCALVAASSALPTGAPASVCGSLQPQGPHVANGITEQSTANPWTIDVCDFDEVMGYYTYTPGVTYNSKSDSFAKFERRIYIILIANFCDDCIPPSLQLTV